MSKMVQPVNRINKPDSNINNNNNNNNKNNNSNDYMLGCTK